MLDNFIVSSPLLKKRGYYISGENVRYLIRHGYYMIHRIKQQRCLTGLTEATTTMADKAIIWPFMEHSGIYQKTKTNQL